jgi:DNA polymerase-3 subunit delta'
VSAPVFADLVGQEHVIQQLERAIHSSPKDSGQEMSHAWLFTGPPGSGRSNIAKAFAAALICRERGCGSCEACITAFAGTHSDVELVDVSGLSIKIDEIREIVSRSSWGASTSNWRVVVIEDCDRMTEAAANALLKALEEPGASTIWLLCAPTLHDVLPTIRSRCRHLNLKTPTTSEIVGFLVEKLDVSHDEARLAAEISQGHIGKAIRFLKTTESRSVRKNTFTILFSIKSEKDALRAAAQLIELAQEQVELRTAAPIEKELDELKAMMQNGSKGMLLGGAKAVKDLERDQKTRSSRFVKDELDGYLLDYLSFFRDCLITDGPKINSDLLKEISTHSKQIPPESISAIVTKLSEIRGRLITNTSQPLLLEAFFTFFTLHSRGNQHPIL